MPAQRSPLVPAMVGRQAPLVELQQLAASVGTDGPVCVVVAGEAGIGKTRLLQELGTALDGSAPVLTGQARESEAQRTFGLVRDLVERSPIDAESVLATLPRWRHPLGHLLEPLVRLEDHPDDGHTHGQEELARAGAALVGSLVEDHPALVVFEDLHWADGGSLEVLGRLARGQAPLLLVATFRPEDVGRGHPLARLLNELDREIALHQLPLAPLTADEVRQFLQQVFDEPPPVEVVDRLHRRTRGNPFFLEELVIATREGSWTGRSPAAVGPPSLLDARLPWTTSEAVLDRLEGLDPSSRELLQSAAVVGDPFDPPTLGAATGWADTEVLATVESLIRAGLLVGLPGGLLTFHHPLVADALAEQVVDASQQLIHREVYDVLRKRDGTDPARLLHHALEAGLTEEAAEHAEPTARTALHRGDTRQALMTAQAGIGAGSTWRLQAIAARAAGWLGEFEVAAEHAERWADEAAAANDRAQLVYANCHLAWCRSWAEDTHGAAAALEAAMTVAADLGDTSAAAHALATRARFEMVWNRPADAAEAAAEATAMAERVGDRRTLASAKLYLAGGILDSPEYQSEEELARAARFLDEARAEAEALGDAETLAAAIHNRLVPEQPDDVPPQASLQLVQEGYRVADRYGNELLRHKIGLLHLYFHVVAGNRAAADEALIHARHAPLSADGVVWREALEVELALAAGAVDVAEQIHTDHLQSGDDHGPAELIDIANATVQLAAHQQDPARAEQGLRQVGAERNEVCPCVAVTWWETAIHALKAGTDPDLITRLLAAEAPTPLPRHAGLSNHTRGALAAAKGDGESALEALGIAVTAERRGRRASLLADAHLQLAELALAQGLHDQAADDLARARSWLDHWPGPLRDRIERRQAEARADPGDGGNTRLTRRELEVVRLVARGYTNGQIADRLFVTTKTVSTHVSNALSKTGFQRRTQLGTWAVREGLADDG